MKFLIDVCVGGRIARWLSDLGYNVVEVRVRDSQMPDEDIMDWAFREERIIATADKDFGELAVLRGKKHYGMVRLPDAPFELRKRLLEQLLEKHSGELHHGKIITIFSNRIRVRNPGNT
jgi:predicted nuclease of predicted toxin-antitoxin system